MFRVFLLQDFDSWFNAANLEDEQLVSRLHSVGTFDVYDAGDRYSLTLMMLHGVCGLCCSVRVSQIMRIT